MVEPSPTRLWSPKPNYDYSIIIKNMMLTDRILTEPFIILLEL